MVIFIHLIINYMNKMCGKLVALLSLIQFYGLSDAGEAKKPCSFHSLEHAMLKAGFFLLGTV